MLDWKKYNITIVDSDIMNSVLDIDKKNRPIFNVDYYELSESMFVSSRLLLDKKNNPVMYWFVFEQIGNLEIEFYNSVLTKIEEVDILYKFYKDRCIESGNTLTIYVPETLTDVCNYLKRYNPQTTLQDSYILFKFFTNHQKDWLDKELTA